MSFTDDDLELLKNSCKGWPDWENKIKALLARLEAAERVCDTPPECNCSQECDWHSEALTAWRKAAGKA